MAQASDVPRAAEYTSLAAAALLDAMCVKSTNLAHASTTIAIDCPISVKVHPGKTGYSRRRGFSKKLRAPRGRVRPYLTPRCLPISSLHQEPDGTLNLATALLYAHRLNFM